MVPPRPSTLFGGGPVDWAVVLASLALLEAERPRAARLGQGALRKGGQVPARATINGLAPL